MSDIEFAEILNEILNEIKSIKKSFVLKTEKIDQINHSSISFDDSDETDLIESFLKELALFDIRFDFDPSLYDVNDLKNRAAFYFTNKNRINSKRPYLLKIVSQLQPRLKSNPIITIEGGSTNKSIDEVNYLVDKFNLITPDMLSFLIEKYPKVFMLVGGRSLDSMTQFQKVVLTGFAIREELIK